MGGIKVLVIGLDGVTWDLLQPWIKEGRLKTIRDMMENGVWGTLESTIPPVTAPAWASFVTGKNPGKHGCYDFVLPYGNLDNIKTITSMDIKGVTFYELLEEKGYRCTLINLPVSYPPRINNVVITSLMTKSKNFVFPPELIKQVPELKEYKITPDRSPLARGRITEYIAGIRCLEKNRFECAKKLFEKEWDFFFILFSGTDWVQHVTYNMLISRTRTERAKIEAVKLYEELDSYIKWFISNVPKDTYIFIMSDHGFRSSNRVFSVNAWLRSEGYLKVKVRNKKLGSPSKLEKLRQSLNKEINPHILGFLLKLLNAGSMLSRVTYSIGRLLKLPTMYSIGRFMHLDAIPSASETIAYSVRYKPIQAVYINDKRRFSSGKVNTGKQIEEIRDEIKNKLKKVKDPKGGKKVFRKVLKKEDVYSGCELEKAPDIILIPNELSLWTSNPFLIFYDAIHNHHDLEGIFIACGPDIKKNRKLKRKKIYDIAPTILHIFGMPVPQDVDGKVLLDIFEENSMYLEKEVRYEKPGKIPLNKKEEVILTLEEKAKVMDRLKKLGYF